MGLLGTLILGVVGALILSAAQRTLTWTDFQQALARTGVDAAQDAVNHPGIVQEVLAEALARAVLVILGHGRGSGPQAIRLSECKRPAV